MRRIPKLLLVPITALAAMGLFASTDTVTHAPRGTNAFRSEAPEGQLAATRWTEPARPTAAPHATPAPHPSSVDPGWLVTAERDLEAHEYFASETPRGLQAPNRAHGLRTYFDANGIRVTDRIATGEPELLRMRLAALGRDGALRPMSDARVSHADARVELAREGVIEWYENSAKGLEQGFTLNAKPAGEGPLVLEIAVEGAQVSRSSDGVALACMGTGARRLGYGALAAVDAHGRALAATLETCDDGLRIVTDDRGAAYPVTIDPLLTNTYDNIIQLGQAGANLGCRVVGAGDVDGDGYSDVLIGAQFYDLGEMNEGAAFLFRGAASGLALPMSTFQSNSAGSLMGRGIASGDFNGDGYSDVVVGCYGYPVAGGAFGAAFIFYGSASGIASGSPATAGTTLKASTNAAKFGIEMCGGGDVNGDGYQDLVVGNDSYAGYGAVFVFHGSATGIPNATETTASTQIYCNQGNALFGCAIGMAGDVNGDGYDDIIVGAEHYDSPEVNEGVAFVFNGGPAGIASGNQTGANAILQMNTAGLSFGRSISGAGDVNGDGYADVLVGTSAFANGQTSEGAVWLFTGGPSGIVNNQSPTSRFESEQASSGLGGWQTIAAAGDVNGDGYSDLILGAPSYDQLQTDEGMAFVVLGCPTGMFSTNPIGTYQTTLGYLQVDQASANFGVSVAGAGDVNGDGYADVIVGALNYDGPASNEGAAFIYTGGNRTLVSGDVATARSTVQANQANARLGYSVAGVGDVNADGYSDIAIGARWYDAGEGDEGAVFMYLGPAAFGAGTPAAAWAMLQGNQSPASFGFSVAGAGDVNGDGFADLIVGAPGYDGRGSAFVFGGGASAMTGNDPSTAMATLTSDQFSQMGNSVAGAGDVNGDGYADVIVGAMDYAGPSAGASAGAAFIFHGGPSGIASGNQATAATRLYSDITMGRFGTSVAGAGDVNADGYADVIVGAPNYNYPESGEGIACIFLGSAAGVPDGGPASSATVLQSDEVAAHLGASVAGAGDVNGDGYPDVIAGAPNMGPGDTGMAWVWYGSASGVANGTPSNAGMTFGGVNGTGYLGATVAGVGDLNGDGFGDILIGEPGGIGTYGDARLYLGLASPPPGWAPSIAMFSSSQLNSNLGFSVAGAGDVDGDGLADFLVGAPAYDSGETDEGTAYLWNGSTTPFARQQRLTQLRGGAGTQPVQSGGTAYDPDDFNVRRHAIGIAGRERVKLEVEHCPPGAAFGTANCIHSVSATWSDAGTSGVDVTKDVAVASSGLYRWRARTLRAPFSVTQPGITASPHPQHGPWRRLEAARVEGEVRIPSGTLDVQVRVESARLALEVLRNPSRGPIEFALTLPGTAPAQAEVFDVAGRRQMARELRATAAARTSVRWDEGSRLAPGCYLLRVRQGERTATARFVVLH